MMVNHRVISYYEPIVRICIIIYAVIDVKHYCEGREHVVTKIINGRVIHNGWIGRRDIFFENGIIIDETPATDQVLMQRACMLSGIY